MAIDTQGKSSWTTERSGGEGAAHRVDVRLLDECAQRLADEPVGAARRMTHVGHGDRRGDGDVIVALARHWSRLSRSLLPAQCRGSRETGVDRAAGREREAPTCAPSAIASWARWCKERRTQRRMRRRTFRTQRRTQRTEKCLPAARSQSKRCEKLRFELDGGAHSRKCCALLRFAAQRNAARPTRPMRRGATGAARRNRCSPARRGRRGACGTARTPPRVPCAAMRRPRAERRAQINDPRFAIPPSIVTTVPVVYDE